MTHFVAVKILYVERMDRPSEGDCLSQIYVGWVDDRIVFNLNIDIWTGVSYVQQGDRVHSQV